MIKQLSKLSAQRPWVNLQKNGVIRKFYSNPGNSYKIFIPAKKTTAYCNYYFFRKNILTGTPLKSKFALNWFSK